MVIGGMVGVTNDPWGTARRSQAGAPYKIAGKTGTAQVFTVGQNREATTRRTSPSGCATTRCSSPSRRPRTRRLAVAVLVENGGSGSGTAAPIARKIFDAYLLPPEQAAAAGTRPSRRRRPPESEE